MPPVPSAIPSAICTTICTTWVGKGLPCNALIGDAYTYYAAFGSTAPSSGGASVSGLSERGSRC